MKALLVDDDATSRRLLRLALSRSFDWEIVEANDGMEALRALEAQDIDMVFLDVHMPVMDGIEVLEALRKSAKHAALPVIMLTNEKDADMVRQVVALGVDDYLVKPLSPGQIGSRVARAIAQRPQASAASRSGWLKPGSTILLVDGDAEFRAFFKKTVGPHATAVTAESGVEAMRLCAELMPHTLLVGSATGLLTPPLLLKRLRANHQLESVSIIVVSEDEERPQWAGDGVAGHVTRTFSAAGFLAQLRRAYGTTTADSAPNYADTLATAAEQALGMMLAVHVERLPEHAAPHDGQTATVDLSSSTASANERVWLHCSNESARVIASAFKTIGVDQVSDEDVRGALGELIGIIAGRVQQAMREHGVMRVCSKARVESAKPALEATTSVFLRAAGATVSVALASAVDLSADAVA